MVITTLNEGQRPKYIHDNQIRVRYNVAVPDTEGESSVCERRETADFGFCLPLHTAGYSGSCPGRQAVKGAKTSLE